MIINVLFSTLLSLHFVDTSRPFMILLWKHKSCCENLSLVNMSASDFVKF